MNDLKEEKKFVHDLAGPLSTAMVVAEILLEDANSAGVNPQLVENLTALRGSLNKMRALVHERRSELLKNSL